MKLRIEFKKLAAFGLAFAMAGSAVASSVEAEYRQLEVRRAAARTELAKLESVAAARIVEDWDAFLALLAMGHGGALAFRETAPSDDRIAGAIFGILAVAYCADEANRGRCSGLAASLAAMQIRKESLQAEIGNLTRTVGRRLAVVNRCGESVAVTVAHDDPVLGAGVRDTWNVAPGRSVYLMQTGVYLRSFVDRVPFHVRALSSGGEWNGRTSNMRFAVDESGDLALVVGCR